jgi:hypothetical protein
MLGRCDSGLGWTGDIRRHSFELTYVNTATSIVSIMLATRTGTITTQFVRNVFSGCYLGCHKRLISADS